MAVGLASDPSRKLKPGKTRLMSPVATVVATPVAASVVVVADGGCVDWVLSREPLLGGRPKPWLLRKNWTP